MSSAISPLFYRLRGPEWRQAGLPCTTKAYELAAAGKLILVKDGAGRTGITAEEAARFFGAVQPLSAVNKRNTAAATTARTRRPA